jgi:FtsH-binding integral membrane protein
MNAIYVGVFQMFDSNYTAQTRYAREFNVMYRIYAWMCIALAITAGTAYYVSTSAALLNLIFTKPFVLVALLIAQLALVVIISGFINKLNSITAILLFLIYSALLGVTLSSIFLVFDLPSIATTFIVTSTMFGATALYGYFTKADLTSLGSIGFMALIGLIIAMLVNIFLKSAAFDYFISGAGVIIFTLLTAYDVQKLKNITQELAADKETMSKIAIVGALTLYLDFVNLFLFLLNIMGRRKE